MHPVMESRLNAPLAERLKNETRALHTAAERSAFMAALLRGRLERQAYCTFLRNLHAIYAALEPALKRHAADPSIAPVFSAALSRCDALSHDLRTLHGTAWTELVVTPAAMDYVKRLHEVDAAEPARLLAHAYVRYLGDLSGGQMLRGIVARGMQWDGSGAVAFYDFGDAPRTAELARAFRAGLMHLNVDDAQSDAIVDEAKRAFALHCRLFDELADLCGLAASPTLTDGRP
jgi:heme oxygenase